MKRPLRGADGTYPLLLASMKAGEVTDITLPRVRRWGEAETQVIQGQPTWMVDVWYQTMAFRGPMGRCRPPSPVCVAGK